MATGPHGYPCCGLEAALSRGSLRDGGIFLVDWRCNEGKRCGWNAVCRRGNSDATGVSGCVENCQCIAVINLALGRLERIVVHHVPVVDGDHRRRSGGREMD